MPRVVMIMGLPASGKSSLARDFEERGYVLLNRDKAGGRVVDLVPKLRAGLRAGWDMVVDNTFVTLEHRAPFVAAANELGASVELHWMQTSFEDCTVNACHRSIDRYGIIPGTPEEIKANPDMAADPNIFPIAVLFAMKRKLEGVKKKGVWEVPCGKPTMDEGYSRIVKVPFVRRPPTGTRKALILDYDGTLRDDARDHGGQRPYPTEVSQVSVLPNVPETLARYADDGYLMLGVTIQSGIERGHLTAERAFECILETNRLAGQPDTHTSWCPHYRFPIACYCRKPQVGLGVMLTREHELNPAECIMVGDKTTDKTFATRCGFQFAWATDFFGWG